MKAIFLAAVFGIATVGIWIVGSSSIADQRLFVENVVAYRLDDGSLAITLDIENSGAPDWLVSVHSPDATAAFVSFDAQEALPIQTGVSLLALDGAHIHLTKFAEPVEEGALLSFTLEFAEAASVDAEARLDASEDAELLHDYGVRRTANFHAVSEGEPVPKLQISTAENGNSWDVTLAYENFEPTEVLADNAHVPGLGHGHVYVGGVKLGRVFDTIYQIGPLPKGKHEVRVSLNTNEHRTYAVDGQAVYAAATITVD